MLSKDGIVILCLILLYEIATFCTEIDKIKPIFEFLVSKMTLNIIRLNFNCAINLNLALKPGKFLNSKSKTKAGFWS